MAKQDKDNESIVEKHALDRLNHVEKEHRKAYAKKPCSANLVGKYFLAKTRSCSIDNLQKVRIFY